MLSVIRKLLLKIVDDIDCGNSELTEEESLEVIKALRKYSRKDAPMSKYQAYTYLNISRAKFDNLVRAGTKHLMENGEKNTGFMYANPDNMRAVLCVGPTTSGAEFLDTVVHEVHHFAVVVASELGIDLEGEAPAYVSGDTIRELADIICHLGCEHCNP